MSDESAIRNELVQLLVGQSAFRMLDHIVADFPASAMNQRPPNVPYTPWALLEHIRVGQNDILEYIRDTNYRSPHWPDEYWPKPDAQADQAAWAKTVAAIKADRDALAAMITDPKVDLTAPLPHAPEHTILRELRLVAGHTSFHLGEFAVLRQVMGTWPADHKL
jgi:hypothetical protein